MSKEKGWDARGRIEIVWKQLTPPKRDELARLSGVLPTELSSHNQGKRLGRDVAQKIIDGALKGGVVVSTLDLGAPLSEADEQGQPVLRILGELRDALGRQQETIDSQRRSIRALQGRVRVLERGQERPPHAGEVR